MKRRYIIIGASVILLGVFLFSGYKLEKNLYEQELERLYESRVLEYEQRLKESERQRVVANHRADSIDLLYKNVVSADSITQKELNSVEGSFQSLTSKELQEKMVEEFNKAQR